MTWSWLGEFLACPACSGEIPSDENGFRCRGCGRVYPVRYGIPDFRLQPDPYIGIEDELEKIRALTAGGGLAFDQLLRRYYQLSPENPPRLHRHYLAAMEAAIRRGEGLLKKLEARFPDAGRSSLLDLGCGTAGLTVAAARRYRHVVGADVALRWLVIGKQRLREEGLRAPLVAVNAEGMPFKTDRFDVVLADSVLEHVRDSRRMRDEVLRVLKPGGVFFFTTNNRYSLLPEPHVRLWGFGLLPRRWMPGVARRLRRTPYRVRLRSRRELRRLFNGWGEVVLPYFGEQELGEHAERLRRWWERLRRVPLARALLGGVVPLYFIFGRKPG